MIKNQVEVCDICKETPLSHPYNNHNAEPVVASGRCCGDCNTTVVIPARIASAERRSRQMKSETPSNKKDLGRFGTGIKDN
jgi:hypothetical protein